MDEENITFKPKKQDMMECFTCPICNNLYDRATSISECLHTFCRKCIEDKIIQEKLRSCPICNVDLGVAPLDKLRADNTWDDLKLKIFKTKPETVKPATETVPIPKQYARRKKKAPSSSLLPTSATVSTSPEPAPDAAPLEPEKLSEQMEAVTLNQSSCRPVVRFRRYLRKNPNPKRFVSETEQLCEDGSKTLPNTDKDNGLAKASKSKGSKQKKKDKKKIPISCDDLRKSLTIDKEFEPATRRKGKEKQKIPISSDDLRKSLTIDKAVEPATRRKGKEIQLEETEERVDQENQNTVFNQSEEDDDDDDVEKFHVEADEMSLLSSSDSDSEENYGEKPKKKKGLRNQRSASTTRRKRSCRTKWKGKGKAYSPPVLRTRKPRNMNGAGTSRASLFQESEKKLDNNNKKPVWFSLVAASNQNTDRPLPQVTGHIKKVENGNLPVSYVKQIIVEKLRLESEDEVDIWLREEPVCSTQILSHLVDWWVETTPMSERKTSMVGSSGAEFCMILHYSRSHLY